MDPESKAAGAYEDHKDELERMAAFKERNHQVLIAKDKAESLHEAANIGGKPSMENTDGSEEEMDFDQESTMRGEQEDSKRPL